MIRRGPVRLVFAGALLFAAACRAAPAPETAVDAPMPARTAHESGLRTAIFAGGCFWGIEGVFSHLRGVRGAVSGYHGGSAADASYERVSEGNTGHAEAVKVTYDPAVIRYDQLLQVFFSVATDPTQLDRQGPDTGRQYRSALVPMDAEQREVAAAYLAQLAKARLWPRPIVTRIEAYRRFYAAEAYHQDFMARNPRQAYVAYWDQPKLAALQRRFPSLYQAEFTRN